ncbi:MAG: hypothetical protein KAJ75_07525 [Alphaproteobacteria bacterium]|nr:hypothetical protein [Alphaproteobacteria bacterium]
MTSIITTEDPELVLLDKIHLLNDAGKIDEAWELRKKIKYPAEALLSLKISEGAEALKKRGLNHERAEKAYGKDWLDKIIISPLENQH